MADPVLVPAVTAASRTLASNRSVAVASGRLSWWANAPGTPVQELDTPALVVDLDAMDRNMQKMRQYAEQHNVKLRPHAKMHKCAEISRMQIISGGACGICVQKLSEAEVQVEGGVLDIFVSNEIVNMPKLRRLARLGIRMRDAASRLECPWQLTVCCDCPEGVAMLAQAIAAEAAPQIGVFLEIDVGQARCGAPPASDQALATAQAVMAHSRQLYFAGIHAYHGAAQHIRTYADREATIRDVAAKAVATKELLEENEIPVPLITGAGTGTFTLEAASGVYGEIQPGSYLVFDRDYADNERDARHPDFEHAMFVASRVVSRGSKPRTAVVDAGHKAHAIDTGLPTVHGRPDIEVLNGGDEHAILVPRAGDAAGDEYRAPDLDELVFLIPGHCDPTVNLHDVIIGVRGGLENGKVECAFAVDGRGCLS